MALTEDVMKNLNNNLGAINHFAPITFNEFLDETAKNPRKLLRNIFQLFYDMFNHYIGEGVNEYPNDPESIQFLKYDTSKLFETGCDVPFFADRIFSNKLVRLIGALKE